MEEWEEQLQAELSETLDVYLAKGFTLRQCIGVLETLKSELMPIVNFEPED